MTRFMEFINLFSSLLKEARPTRPLILHVLTSCIFLALRNQSRITSLVYFFFAISIPAQNTHNNTILPRNRIPPMLRHSLQLKHHHLLFHQVLRRLQSKTFFLQSKTFFLQSNTFLLQSNTFLMLKNCAVLLI